MKGSGEMASSKGIAISISQIMIDGFYLTTKQANSRKYLQKGKDCHLRVSKLQQQDIWHWMFDLFLNAFFGYELRCI